MQLHELALECTARAMLYASREPIDIHGYFSAWPLTLEEAQVMVDFVRDNPEAPVDAMSIHLALTKRQPRVELSAVDRFALKLFHQAVTAAIAFDKEIEAIELGKLQPQPLGRYPGRQSFVPEPAPFAPTGFQTVR